MGMHMQKVGTLQSKLRWLRLAVGGGWRLLLVSGWWLVGLAAGGG